MRLALLLFLSPLIASAIPQRIVSTAPSFTETLFAIGAGSRVVAVSTYCHFPDAANALPRIGSYLQPNIEAIARLQPDLVLVHSEQKAALAQLAVLGIKTLVLKNTSLEDTLHSFATIGEAVGLTAEGVAFEKRIRAKLTSLENQSKLKPTRTLLFIVGRTPGRLDGMIAVGKGSFLNEVIRIAGGKNVLFDSPVAYPKISMEAVLRLAPDVIVDMGDMAATTGVTEAHKHSVVKLWEAQTEVRAVRAKKVFAVAADIFVVPGPRVVEAAEAFAAMMQ